MSTIFIILFGGLLGLLINLLNPEQTMAPIFYIIGFLTGLVATFEMTRES